MSRVIFWLAMVCLALTQAFLSARAEDTTVLGWSFFIAFIAASNAVLAAARFLRSAR